VESQLVSLAGVPGKPFLGIDCRGGLEEVSLTHHAFRRFGETLGAIYDAGKYPVDDNWSAVVVALHRLGT
jgi:hypothetical protein